MDPVHSTYLTVFDKVIDSRDFTVGGGSASALAGAMAAGMVSMAARLSAPKPSGLSPEEYGEIAVKADALAKELLDGSVKDTEAYLMIKNSYALPKSTEAQKEERSRAIREAAWQAALVPMENGFRNRTVYELYLRLDGASNPACISDLKSAGFLAMAGMKGCVLNIEANLPLVKDEVRTAKLNEAAAELCRAML